MSLRMESFLILTCPIEKFRYKLVHSIPGFVLQNKFEGVALSSIVHAASAFICYM